MIDGESWRVGYGVVNGCGGEGGYPRKAGYPRKSGYFEEGGYSVGGGVLLALGWAEYMVGCVTAIGGVRV